MEQRNRRKLKRILRSGRRGSALALGAVLSVIVSSRSFPTNNDPGTQIRFNTRAEAEARRQKLIQFIWPDGLPDAMPEVERNVEFPPLAVGIDPYNAIRVDKLDMDVSSWDFHSIAYMFHPRNPARRPRVAIVHDGHSGSLDAGVGSTVNRLLIHGFIVIALKMPLFGWNDDNTAIIPGAGVRTYSHHYDIIYETDENNPGSGFRMFLEPVVQVLNLAIAENPKLEDVTMIGLSGGGWTTSMMAAIDKRIQYSVPVAGSAPLYERNQSRRSVGDAEQWFPPLYAENITADGRGGGIATWLEIHALGAIGEGRKQVQVTNEFDACCFAGRFPDSYKTVVESKVKAVGSGEWRYLRDSTHRRHQISHFTMKEGIDALLGLEGTNESSGLPIVDTFETYSNGMLKVWNVESSRSKNRSVSVENGAVLLQGNRQLSIVRGPPLNPQCCGPLKITLRLGRISSDCVSSVFLANESNSRGVLVGAYFDASTKNIGVLADRSDHFDAGDSLLLGSLPSYAGGPVTMSILLDTIGFSVDVDAGSAGSFRSKGRPWIQIPNGFDLASLGTHAQLFVQCVDIDEDAPAAIKVESVEVRAVKSSAIND